jgi:3-methyladenine DNA glycosylase Mpg
MLWYPPLDAARRVAMYGKTGHVYVFSIEQSANLQLENLKP